MCVAIGLSCALRHELVVHLLRDADLMDEDGGPERQHHMRSSFSLLSVGCNELHDLLETAGLLIVKLLLQFARKTLSGWSLDAWREHCVEEALRVKVQFVGLHVFEVILVDLELATLLWIRMRKDIMSFGERVNIVDVCWSAGYWAT